ncbi:MAG: hypothetical protein OSB45_14585 [Pseudomonadales bacterium]|nr:hypothetical protein [Pseudomonadales bacterium]
MNTLFLRQFILIAGIALIGCEGANDRVTEGGASLSPETAAAIGGPGPGQVEIPSRLN